MEVWFRYRVFVLFRGWGGFSLFLGLALHKPDSCIWQVLFYATYTATCTAGERFQRPTSLLVKATTSKQSCVHDRLKGNLLPFFILIYRCVLPHFPMPYPCIWPMLFLHIAHLSSSPAALVLFNNPLFLHLLILPLPEDKVTGSHAGTHAAPETLLWQFLLSSITSMSSHWFSHQAGKTQRPQLSHQEPSDVICPIFRQNEAKRRWLVKWLTSYGESRTGSRGGSGVLIQSLLRSYTDHSSNRKGGEQERQSREERGSLQPKPSSISLDI